MNRLNVITTEPPNAGTPLDLIDGRSLDVSEVYMRNNFEIPHEATSRIEVELVNNSRIIEATTLQTLPRVQLEMVLECAGNGRIFMDPIPSGTPWDLGGVSPVRFGGAKLLDVLGAVPDDVTELVFTGADVGSVEPEGEIHYEFSLGRELWSKAIIADEMSSQPLTKEHGGPLRLVVPGQYAMKSVKWLRSISGTTTPFTGHFVNKYRYFGDTEMPESAAVGEIQVRAVVATPFDGEVLAAGRKTIAGAAWSGSGNVVAVELSLDGGSKWMAAELGDTSGPYAATPWTLDVELDSGDYLVEVRARDAQGSVQPSSPRWNANGYANNVTQRVRIRCR